MRVKDLKIGEQYKVKGMFHPVTVTDILPGGMVKVEYRDEQQVLNDDMEVVSTKLITRTGEISARQVERTWFSFLAQQKRERAKWAEEKAVTKHVKEQLAKLGIVAQVGMMKDYLNIKILCSDGAKSPQVQKFAAVLSDVVVWRTLDEIAEEKN